MKHSLLYGLTFLLFLTMAVSCHNNSKKKQHTETEKQAAPLSEAQQKEYYKRLEGTVGGQPAILHLIKTQSLHKEEDAATTDRYSGIFLSGGKPLEVAGYVQTNSAILLVTYSHYAPLDTLSGKFSGDIFEGKMRTQDGQPLNFSFTEKYPEGSYRWLTATYNDSMAADKADTGNLKAVSNLMALWPGKDLDSLQHLFTDTICKAFFGAHKTFSNPEDLLKTVSDTFLLNYKTTAAEVLKEQRELRPTFNWDRTAHMDITYNANYKVSLIYTQYQYLGGAHGLQSVFCFNADTKTGKVLHLSDIFKPGYEKTLSQKLEQELRQQYDIPENAALNGEQGILFGAHLPVSSNFYLTPQGIGFVYNPYEVAPYVVGEINLYLPFNKITKLLK